MVLARFHPSACSIKDVLDHREIQATRVLKTEIIQQKQYRGWRSPNAICGLHKGRYKRWGREGMLYAAPVGTRVMEPDEPTHGD